MQDSSLNIQMQNNASSYRPHNPGHDYYAPGIYLITLVVRNRRDNAHLLGALNNSLEAPAVQHTAIGKAVLECWEGIPARQAMHQRHVIVHIATCMPDHFHGVIEVKERMDVSLGKVIRGFKVGCTMAWKAIQRRPSMATETGETGACMTTETGATPHGFVQPYLDEQAEREMLKRMSKKQRAAYYAQHIGVKKR